MSSKKWRAIERDAEEEERANRREGRRGDESKERQEEDIDAPDTEETRGSGESERKGEKDNVKNVTEHAHIAPLRGRLMMYVLFADQHKTVSQMLLPDRTLTFTATCIGGPEAGLSNELEITWESAVNRVNAVFTTSVEVADGDTAVSSSSSCPSLFEAIESASESLL